MTLGRTKSEMMEEKDITFTKASVFTVQTNHIKLTMHDFDMFRLLKFYYITNKIFI